MMMPAILLVAILGSPQAPPAAPPAKAAPKAAKKTSRKKAAPKPAEPAAGEDTGSAAAPAAAPTESASDAIQAGLAAFGRHRFAQAKADFEKAVAADPQSAAAHFYLGYTIYKIAEPMKHDSPGKHEAAEQFAKAYELDPNFKPVWGGHKG